MNTDAICGAITALDEEIAGLMSVRDRLRELLPRDTTTSKPKPPAIARTSIGVPLESPRRTRVLAATPAEAPARVKDIAATVDEPQSHVHADIQTLQKQGHVERVSHGAYQRTERGTEVLETVWSGASKRPLIDRETPEHAQRERA